MFPPLLFIFQVSLLQGPERVRTDQSLLKGRHPPRLLSEGLPTEFPPFWMGGYFIIPFFFSSIGPRTSLPLVFPSKTYEGKVLEFL